MPDCSCNKKGGWTIGQPAERPRTLGCARLKTVQCAHTASSANQFPVRRTQAALEVGLWTGGGLGYVTDFHFSGTNCSSQWYPLI